MKKRWKIPCRKTAVSDEHGTGYDGSNGSAFQAENLMEREGDGYSGARYVILSNTDRFNGSTVLAYPGLQEKLETLFRKDIICFHLDP